MKSADTVSARVRNAMQRPGSMVAQREIQFTKAEYASDFQYICIVPANGFSKPNTSDQASLGMDDGETRGGHHGHTC